VGGGEENACGYDNTKGETANIECNGLDLCAVETRKSIQELGSSVVRSLVGALARVI